MNGCKVRISVIRSDRSECPFPAHFEHWLRSEQTTALGRKVMSPRGRHRNESGTEKLNTEIELLEALVRGYPPLWCAVYANPNCERRAFMSLTKARIVAHHPAEQHERQQVRLKRKAAPSKLIFTRYLFICFDLIPKRVMTLRMLVGAIAPKVLFLLIKLASLI